MSSSAATPAEVLREWNLKLKVPQLSLNDKLELLVLRDKVHRITLQRRSKTELNNENSQAGEAVIKGTCPEICPEKERYERTSQGRISSFERNRHMIKDFSRQAADQDMPLPSELRTPDALRMTMNYLLREVIAELPEDSSGSSGWYDFVWRRIREIRKEITQQRLTGLHVCELMEEMCRFHIIAFHLCCEADKNQFDVKLNLENLNDCLATLGRLYSGLESQKIYSQNVAEFRSYELLLRVWTGKLDLVKMTADIANLPLEIQNSNELTFAWDVISACNNRMFKEYVDLMKKADCLTACLMHLSLPMIQARSLNNIAIASGSRLKAVANIPENLFSTLLGLETESELTIFCDYHGLTYDHGNRIVSLKPGGEISRDPKLFPRSRSVTVIEPKLQQKNVAEWIAKKSLTEIPQPEVVELNSFDQNNMYIGPDPSSSIEKENILSVTATIRSSKSVPAVSGNFIKSSALSSVVKSASSVPDSTLFRPFVPNEQYLTSAFSSIVPRSSSSVVQPEKLSQVPLPTSPVKMTSLTVDGSARKRTRSIYEEATDQSQVSDNEDVPERKRRDSAFSQILSSEKSDNSTPTSPKNQRYLCGSLLKSPLVKYSEPEEERAVSPVLKKNYPSFTHLILLKARSICQSSCVTHRVFNAWRTYVNGLRRPSHYFGHLTALPEMEKIVHEQKIKEEQELIWRPFPFRSKILNSKVFKVNTCVLVVIYVGNENSVMPRWILSKLGQPDNGDNLACQVYVYEDGTKELKIVFLNYLVDMGKSATLLDDVADDAGAVLFYCEKREDLISTRRILENIRRVRYHQSDIPVGLFCADLSVMQEDLSDLKVKLLRDYFVAQSAPTLELNAAVWDVIVWLIVHRARIPLPSCTTLMQLVAQLYCDFTRIYQEVQEDLVAELPDQLVIELWNNIVSQSCDMIRIIVDRENTYNTLKAIVDAQGLEHHLKLTESSLWQTSSIPETYPFALAGQSSSEKRPLSNSLKTVAQKVLTVSAMASISDPLVIRRKSNSIDLNQILKDFLEQVSESLNTETQVPYQENERSSETTSDRGSQTESNIGCRDIMEVVENFNSDKTELEDFFGEMKDMLDSLENL